ncbi:extracellular serine/threonine protein kinase four-jointed [Bicyclus anynana]|uniref:Extracellular serine/threonine protein kinase four-jointed n=1 Tax=Bicyclus anynana TaxID=110368 RepID=A0A6J1PBU2_BICAN|nr:extracellular serine/threonine protein kinase four-jointed [Bicyclus anynana]
MGYDCKQDVKRGRIRVPGNMATFTQIEDKNEIIKQCGNDRLPTLNDIERNSEIVKHKKIKKSPVDMNCYKLKKPYILYNNFRYKDELSRISTKREYGFYSYCFISVCLSFILGLLIGVAIVGSPDARMISPSYNPRKFMRINTTRDGLSRSLNSLKLTDNFKVDKNFIFSDKEKDIDRFATVSFTGAIEPHKHKMDVYPKGLTDDMKEILKDNKAWRHKHTILSIVNTTLHEPNDETVLFDNIYWGPEVENSMPQGYGENSAEIWERFVNQSEIIKMETGCGRMQNRLVTFKDGIQACVRYRQNTDQIQGEIFSFYVARLLNLTNVAPSVVKVVDLKDKLWQSVTSDIASAQWNTNRAVVLTQYIPSLESATIPEIFKPSTRHLNKMDVFKICFKENSTSDTSKQILIDKLRLKNVKSKKDEVENFDYIDAKLNKKTIDLFVELAQWSDLIIFDYLTANLDRIVNNLFNYQWNINIMDGPAHNLARKMDSGLLLFLDNESGLLHGYRLLKKYNMYHSLMLDNLCVFRKKTVDALKHLYETSIGSKLSDIFHKKNNAVIRDILPPLPEKNAKILHDRIGKVLNQIEKCEKTFLNTR